MKKRRGSIASDAEVRTEGIEGLFLGDMRRLRRSDRTRKRGQPYVLRRRVAVHDVVSSRWAFERRDGGGSRILYVYPTPDALAVTDHRNLLTAHLLAHVAFAAIPGARAVKESIAKCDGVDARILRPDRLQLGIPATAGRDRGRCVHCKQDRLVGQTRARRIPESRRLQDVAAHARFAENRQQICVTLNTNLAIAFGSSFHFRRGVMLGQRRQFVDYRIGAYPRDRGSYLGGVGRFRYHRASAQFAKHLRRLLRSRQSEHYVTRLLQTTNDRPAYCSGRTCYQDSHGNSFFRNSGLFIPVLSCRLFWSIGVIAKAAHC